MTQTTTDPTPSCPLHEAALRSRAAGKATMDFRAVLSEASCRRTGQLHTDDEGIVLLPATPPPAWLEGMDYEIEREAYRRTWEQLAADELEIG